METKHKTQLQMSRLILVYFICKSLMCIWQHIKGLRSEGLYLNIQSTLVISTSVISNNRLSRRENLILVLTQKSNIR